MFETYFKKQPFICYKEPINEEEPEGNLNYNACKELLEHYHDPEVYYIVKYGICTPKMLSEEGICKYIVIFKRICTNR